METRMGHVLLAAGLGCESVQDDMALRHQFPPGHGDSWILDVYPAPGLCVSNAYFTLRQPWACHLTQAGLGLCSFDSGDVTVLEQGRRKRKLQRGVHVLVNQDSPADIVLGGGEYRYTCIWICPEFLESYLNYRTFKQPVAITDALKWQRKDYNTPDQLMVWEQLKFGIRNAVAPLMYFESKVLELLALIMLHTNCEWYGKRYVKRERPRHTTYLTRPYLRRVKEALDNNIADPPDIRQLSRIAGMGATKLRMVFKNSYGMPIAGYVRQEKMKQAMRLLSGELSIQDIGKQLGYESASKFAAAFKKVHGFTPSQFRKSFGLYSR